jgi:type II secretory pathway pseudopilin PulG
MEKKMMYALVVVVIIVVVVAVAGAYVLMNSGGGGGTKNTYTVANATSLQYNAEATYQGAAPVLFNCAAKNVGATDMVLRIDVLGGESGNYTYIMYHGDQTAWVAVNGTWTNVSSDFTNQWNTWVGTGKRWTTDVDHLATDWSGTGDYTYIGSTTGATIRIYNVAINPTLADSLFQPNT